MKDNGQTKCLLEKMARMEECEEAGGHDVIWAGEWPQDPGDDGILERALMRI